MVGTAILSVISLLGVAFMYVFFGAVCRERRHIKVCMLLRKELTHGMGRALDDEFQEQRYDFEVTEDFLPSARMRVVPKEQRILVFQGHDQADVKKVA